ncbi:MAG: hypothetical protein LBN97_03855 [Oscillospiraceae bacterium]|nr:hypothetical protein [Oscillospiraceae bacterium]
MRLAVSLIDWKSANAGVRGDFAFSDEAAAELMSAIAPRVSGCVLLSTCNRCELYITSEEEAQPSELLCEAAGLDSAGYAFVTLTEEAAVRHLLSVACGLESQIPGEEQILTQLKTAALNARNVKSSDGILQTLFRIAVTCGKAARTQTRLVGTPPSVAAAAIFRARERFGTLEGKTAAVIGSGRAGKLCAGLLLEEGCKVTVTVRTYKHGGAEVPEGCEAIPYGERFAAIDGADLVFSATASPKLTITYDEFAELSRKPVFLADLAVPYDADRRLKTFPGLTLINMDDFSESAEGFRAYNAEALAQIAVIEDKYCAEFLRWLNNRVRYREVPRFPLFIDLSGRNCVVIGAGTIGTRRAKALLSFGANVTVVAPNISEHIDGAVCKARAFEASDLEGVFLAVAAVNDRSVNRGIARLAKDLGVFASVADSPEESTFWFPASAVSDRLNIGIVSRSGEHSLVAETARRIRKMLGQLEEL